MSYLRYLCLFAHSGVQDILCCVFVLYFFVLLPVCLDYSFCIDPSVLSDVYKIDCSIGNSCRRYHVWNSKTSNPISIFDKFGGIVEDGQMTGYDNES